MSLFNIVNAGSMVGGQPEDVSQVLANFQAIQTILNGGIDDVNIRPTAAINPSKLLGYPALATKALFGDGTWRVPAASDLAGYPANAAQVLWGNNTWRVPTAADVTNAADKSSAAAQVFTGSLSTGPAAVAIGMAIGGFMSAGGTNTHAASGSAANSAVFLSTVVGDVTDWRFLQQADGLMMWGPGSGARDLTVGRGGAGVLAIGTTTQAARVNLFTPVGLTAAFDIYKTTDANPTLQINNDGSYNMGPGGATAPDTIVSRAVAGQANVVNKVLEGLPASPGLAVPITFTPNLSTGLTQRAGVTSGGAATLTIAAPLNPPSGTQTALLVIQISNQGGGTITLAWNAAYQPGNTLVLPANLATAKITDVLFVWDSANWRIVSVG